MPRRINIPIKITYRVRYEIRQRVTTTLRPLPRYIGSGQPQLPIIGTCLVCEQENAQLDDSGCCVDCR